MAGYFSSHPNVNEFWFCSDGLAFFDAATAQAHAAALKKAGKSDAIQAVTRADVETWWAAFAPQYAATCATDLGAAQIVLSNAEAALAALPAKTVFSKKALFIKAVNDAKKNVAAAEHSLNTANADVQQAADKATLTAAENKLKADAAITGTTSAALDADKAAVDAAITKVEDDQK